MASRSRAGASAKGDHFGGSVAIDGATAVIGAGGKKSSTGAAYVFARSGTSWSQQAELSVSDGSSGDSFGSSVALSGPTVLVGAYGRNSFTGAGYVFVHSGGSWQQEAELSASDGAAGDEFGYSVAIDGSTAVIGAFATNPTGAAYAFLLPSQQAKLTASDGAEGDNDRESVAIDGSTAVVGAHGNNRTTGAAYVFVQSGGSWHQQAKLTASDGAEGDYFGWSVAISGSTAVIGADEKNSGTGAAYVFVRSGSTWSQQAKLTASDGAVGDASGSSVAISGSTAVVGALGKNSITGAAYVFVRSGATWSQQAELTASDGAKADLFGDSVAISGSTAIIGARQHDAVAGAAYVFVRSGATWSQQAELTASDGAAGDAFGDSVALSGWRTQRWRCWRRRQRQLQRLRRRRWRRRLRGV